VAGAPRQAGARLGERLTCTGMMPFVRFELHSPRRAAVGLALLLFAIVFALEASGSAGVVALVIALVGLVLVVLA
jgi:hypothetical protein